MAPLRGFDRIDVANDVGDRNVGCREFFYESVVPVNPIDLGLVAMQFDLPPAVSAQRLKRVVIDLRSGDDRDLRVE